MLVFCAADDVLFTRLPAHIERSGVYRKRLRLFRNAARHYIEGTGPRFTSPSNPSE
jgi:hypothetical protein